MPKYHVIVVETIISRYPIAEIEVSGDDDDDSHEAVQHEAERLRAHGMLGSADEAVADIAYEIVLAPVPSPVIATTDEDEDEDA